jgi:hypothetical protein
MKLGKRKKYDLDRVVHSQSDTIDRRWGAGVGRVGRSCRSVVSVRSTAPREVKVEISVARAVGSINRVSVPFCLRNGYVRFILCTCYLYLWEDLNFQRRRLMRR